MKPAISRLQLSAAGNSTIHIELSSERHYSVRELAKIWKLSENTIRRMFESEPDVLRWGHNEQRFSRRYVTLRIPESVVLRVHRQLRAAS